MMRNRVGADSSGLQVLPLQMERISSPLGEILVVDDLNGNLRAAEWADDPQRLTRLLDRSYGKTGYALNEAAVAQPIKNCFARYFDGDIYAINEIAVITAGTMFQNEVWKSLRTIRGGTSMSYSGLSAQLGRVNAARAVGHANGANPVNIIIPCHRLVGANGDLTGYAGGIERKRWLLAHEKRYAVEG